MFLRWRVRDFFKSKNISADEVAKALENHHKDILKNVISEISQPKNVDFDFLEALAIAIKLNYEGDLGISDLLGFSKKIPPKYDEEGQASAAWSRGN